MKKDIQQSFLVVKEFTDQMKLKVNFEKTHFMMITSGQKRAHHNFEESIKFGEDEIPPSISVRCLGVQVIHTLC